MKKNKFIIFIKKVKNFFINIWNNNPIDLIVPIIAILILIISSFTIGILKAILIYFFINIIYFIPNIVIKVKKYKGSETNNMKNKSENQKKSKNITISEENKEKIKININDKKKVKRIKTKEKTKNKKSIKKIFKIILLTILLFFILGILGIAGFCAYIVVNAPKFDPELLYVTDPSIVYTKDGKEIMKLGEEKRIVLEYDEIPEVLIDAIIATEDSRFFEHQGVDWARFLKASFFQLLGQSDAGGASTLTMQVSKNNISQDNTASGLKGIIRKFTDVYISLFKLEKNYTKQQIMEFYVNTYWLGTNSYGVEQISLTYFGKSAKELNLSEAAMIAGLFQAPGSYNPYKNPEATEKRRQTVLKLMKRHGYITDEEYQIAKELTVDKIVIPQEESAAISSNISPYQSFIDTVVEQVKEKTGYNPYTTPMKIYTTLDTNIQDYVNDIMSGKSYDWENDVVKAGIAIINVKDGSVAAIGGNRKNDKIDNFNYATDTKTQIGSTAKPLYDYGPAIEYNNWSTYQIIVDEPFTYSNGTKINNWNGKFEGLETMRIALKGSRNIPALKTFIANRQKNIIEFVTKLGLTPEIYSCDDGYTLEGKKCIDQKDPSIVIDAHRSDNLHEAHSIGGYNGESPLTLAAAYNAFANGGVYIEPYTFTKVIYQETGEEYTNEITKTKAMSEETAYMVSDMLVTTATQAMGRYYKINNVKYAAKTGTTNYPYEKLKEYGLHNTNAVNDLWTVGFNTEYTIGVWYGYDKLSSEYYNKLSSAQHTRLFQAVGKKVLTNSKAFTKPSKVVKVEVEAECPEATLPSEYTPSDLRITELFIKGTEPTTISNRFSKLNDVSNLNISEVDGKITLTWDEVQTPEVNTEEYLLKYYEKTFTSKDYLNKFVKDRLSYNEKNIGTLGYNIYLEDASGKLTLLDFVSSNKYELTIDTSGDYKFVVKTSYSIFKSNMSDGKKINISVTIKTPLIPEENIDSENNNTNTEVQPDNNIPNTEVQPDNNNTNSEQITTQN